MTRIATFLALVAVLALAAAPLASAGEGSPGATDSAKKKKKAKKKTCRRGYKLTSVRKGKKRVKVCRRVAVPPKPKPTPTPTPTPAPVLVAPPTQLAGADAMAMFRQMTLGKSLSDISGGQGEALQFCTANTIAADYVSAQLGIDSHNQYPWQLESATALSDGSYATGAVRRYINGQAGHLYTVEITGAGRFVWTETDEPLTHRGTTRALDSNCNGAP